jgi:hypothetical protein
MPDEVIGKNMLLHARNRSMNHTEETMNQGAHCGCGGPHSAMQARSKSHDEAHSAASALDILDERFARGEIEKAEYLEKKQLISQRAPAPQSDQPEQAPVGAEPTPTPKEPAGTELADTAVVAGNALGF